MFNNYIVIVEVYFDNRGIFSENIPTIYDKRIKRLLLRVFVLDYLHGFNIISTKVYNILFNT